VLPPAAVLGLAGGAVMVARFGASPVLPAYGYLAGAGAVLAVTDARQRRLPDHLTLPSYPVALALLGVAALVMPDGARHYSGALLGMAAALAMFLGQAFVYPAALGWGDVKLSGLLGLYLGWLGPGPLLAGLFLGYLLAAVAGLGLIAARRATRKSQLPFGPFLLAGTLAAITLSALSPPFAW
jgi:leader peptidase (prepilin peptidase) / N-methyltransferase